MPARLQDHDRAWILGETTFGKGLVQTVYPLAENTGLALTTAHFYTPSGRLIQRDYSNKSFYDYYFHKDGITRNPNDVKMTDSGRTVYGGGGITPDEKYATRQVDPWKRSFTATGCSTSPASTSPSTYRIAQGLDAGRRHAERAPRLPAEERHGLSPKPNSPQDHDWIKRYLAKEMYIYAFNVDESDRVFAMTDPEVELAVKALPKASALSQNAHKIIVQRMGAQHDARR